MSQTPTPPIGIVTCPHCIQPILIEKLNCGIFRHGVVISTGMQIPPHASKSQCDNYVENRLIYGCGKPFRIEISGDGIMIQICDYI